MPGVRELGCPLGSKAIRDRHIALPKDGRRFQARPNRVELNVQAPAPSGISAVAVRNAPQRAANRVDRRALNAFHLDRAGPYLPVRELLVVAFNLLHEDLGTAGERLRVANTVWTLVPVR